MRALQIVLACLIASTIGVAYGQDTGCSRRTTKLSEDFAGQLVERAFKIDETAEGERERVRKAVPLAHLFCAEPIVLNRQGGRGLLIHMADVADSFGGMYSYPIWVYQRTAKGYDLLLEDMAGYLAPIIGLKTFTNGYRDIRTQNRNGATEHEITIFKFDGKRYRPGVCITETYLGKKRGRERFKYARHKCESDVP
jgi:hypothetical protein